MRWTIAAVLAAVTVAGAQGPAQAPALTSEEAIMVDAVRAVQAQAQAACEALPAVQQYTALLTKANAALSKSGKSVNWATGAVSAAAPAKAEAKR
jgi:hypothetical protein